MNKTTVRGFGVGSRAIKFVTLSSLLVLTACAKFDPDDMAGPSQQELLAELEKNQLAWNNSGVAQYSLAVEKDCDCPDELKSKMKIFVDDVDDLDEEDELFDVLGTDSTATSRAKTGITSRERSDDNRNSNRNVQSAQSPRVETLFTDLRQAILQNAVQQVTYNPEYGFPQTVLVNNAANTQFAGISSSNRSRNSDSDDDNRNTFSPLTIQTSNFQVLGSRNGVRNGLNDSFNDDFNSVSLNGQFIRQNTSGVNAANQLFLVDDDGRWNQLSAPTNILNTLNTFPNQSRVSVTGQRFPGGINGQGYINLQQIVPNQSIRNDNNLRGVLNYSVLDNTSFDVDDFFVTNDSGRNVFINVPSNLRDQAFSLAGQRINLNGNWTPAFNAPNARFNPNGFNTVATVLESFNGILMPSTAAGVFQSNYVLVNDFGAMQELQVPAIFSNSFNSFVGKRVEIQGTRINTGAFGQPVILVQGLKEIQNIFTNSQQISGTVSTVYSGSGFGGVQTQTVLLQMDTGNSVTVQIPANFTNPYNPITTGMRIQVTGAWISNSGFGQGQFEARAPVQITNLGYNAVATYSGFVSNIGSVGNGVNCNAAQNNYSFTSDTGQQFQLLVSNTTQIVGLNNQGFNLPYQARIQVSGTQLSPGVLQAQTITVSPQFETNISGTIIEIGSAGSTFTCAGQLNTYRLLDASGNAYSITTSASSIIQGGQGAYLRIGDQVLVTGTMSNTGTTFFASQIIATAATYPNAPYIPGPT
ncbi:MAG: hypothetical protein OEX07_07505, partial [Gammaproteobacteria bacterium]|nr:hypothetical protein [Gammaproteobacteria bacterium]